MSATSRGDSGDAGDDRQSQTFTRFMRRASKVLRPKSNRDSMTSQGGVGGDASVAGGNGGVLAEMQPRATPLTATTSKPAMSSLAHMKEREEKARALFAKYGLKLEPGEWATPRASETPWVEKRIVMRVHRQCHRCQTPFGAARVCASCKHTRCKKCPRDPAKRSKEHRKEAAEGAMVGTAALPSAGGGAAVPDPSQRAKSAAVQLTIPSRFNQDLVRRHPVQRVRRWCHHCDTLFVGKALQCESCKHQRCPSCRRDPPKTKKYPDGYPGDVEETFPLSQRVYRPIRTRFRWECHDCKVPFIQHEKICRQCKHERCDRCLRFPPKKDRAQPNPDVIKSLNEKMGALLVSPSAAA